MAVKKGFSLFLAVAKWKGKLLLDCAEHKASKVLKSGKKRKEVKNDLLSNMAPPLGLEPRTL
ncbi:hypothetical protein N8831_01310 [Flavobacteriaceae bacterium]|nr:hypothetical protein [Flavobacteriaceae bacterium]